jgi:hypothetical protein
LLHVASQSFAEALHLSFVTTAVALFLVSALAFVLLRRGGRITTYSAPIETPDTRAPDAESTAVEAVDSRSTAAVPVEVP